MAILESIEEAAPLLRNILLFFHFRAKVDNPMNGFKGNYRLIPLILGKAIL